MPAAIAGTPTISRNQARSGSSGKPMSTHGAGLPVDDASTPSFNNALMAIAVETNPPSAVTSEETFERSARFLSAIASTAAAINTATGANMSHGEISAPSIRGGYRFLEPKVLWTRARRHADRPFPGG